MKSPKREKRRFVDYLAKDEDHECALLGALGFSSNLIMRQTGLRPGQISYRLHKADISRMEFRNGTSPWARMMMSNMKEVAEPRLNEYLRRYSPKLSKRDTEYVRRHPQASPRRS